MRLSHQPSNHRASISPDVGQSCRCRPVTKPASRLLLNRRAANKNLRAVRPLNGHDIEIMWSTVRQLGRQPGIQPSERRTVESILEPTNLEPSDRPLIMGSRLWVNQPAVNEHRSKVRVSADRLSAIKQPTVNWSAVRAVKLSRH